MKNFPPKLIYSFLPLAFILLCLAGCETLPPGTPPHGAIVKITATSNEILPQKSAVDNMTTALATCPKLYTSAERPTVGFMPTKILDKEFEPHLRSLTALVYRNLNEMDMIKPPMFSKSPKYLLSSAFLEVPDNSVHPVDNKIKSAVFVWELRLVSPHMPKKILWKQSLKVRIEKPRASNK